MSEAEHAVVNTPVAAHDSVARAASTASRWGVFAPFHRRAFAVIWVATVIGNIGTFMASLASSWLVTDLSGSPQAVALVQAAATLPIFVLSIPAGVLADILDRRRFLIGIQIMLGLTSCGLALLSLEGRITVGSLVYLNLAGGVGAALMGPAWQAIVPELVMENELPQAVAMNSLGINIARSIGPAVGGLLLASAGAAATYGIDAASYVFVIASLVWWRRAVREPALREDVLGAFRAGLRYARASRGLHRLLLRAGLFYFLSSALWALLPLVARDVLHGEAGLYGVLLGVIGAGAIATALALPALRRQIDADAVLLGASMVTAIVMACLAAAPPRWVAIIALTGLGGAWIVGLTTFNSATQAILPNWVRGRMLAVFLTIFNGAMTGGTLCWGWLAEVIGVRETLAVDATLLLVAAIAIRTMRLPGAAGDLQPANTWPDPVTAGPVENTRGPVLVLIEYRITTEKRARFLRALGALSEGRRRDGAYAWGVTEDVAASDRIVEWFMVESWAEHLRQHSRASGDDAALQFEVTRLHEGPEAPQVRHLLAL
jgi:MFS family permease